MNKLINLYTSAELICFITALVCLFKAKEFYWRLLILFMLITCAVEIGCIPLKAIYKANPIPINSNAWIYNIYIVIQIAVFTTVFYNLIGKYTRRNSLLLTGALVLVLIYVYELLTNKAGIYDYNSIAYSAMSVLFVLYCLYFYYLLLNSHAYTDLKFFPDFWWVTGTLFFFFGATAINLYYQILFEVPLSHRVFISYINDTLIVILYSCWSYAFICKRWITSNK
jgi:hypothetical protein